VLPRGFPQLCREQCRASPAHRRLQGREAEEELYWDSAWRNILCFFDPTLSPIANSEAEQNVKQLKAENARIYFATTPIMPNVKGRVIEVPVEPNAPLKQGDILFKIDPQPYQYVVDQKKAQLAGGCR
jgi:hypothetical protein